MMSRLVSAKQLLPAIVLGVLVVTLIVSSQVLAQSGSSQSSGVNQSSWLDEQTIEYNKEKYKEFEEQKKKGVGLVILSAILVMPVAIFFCALSSVPYIGDAGTGMILIGGLVGVGGIALIARGAIHISDGNSGMRRAEKNRFYPERTTLQSTDTTAIDPMELQAMETTRVVGPTLSFTF